MNKQDHQAEEAVGFYTSIFKNSKVLGVSRYGESGPGPKGGVMTVAFHLDGQEVVALNGGPTFKFTEAISLVVNCETQQEVDEYWEKLSKGGGRIDELVKRGASDQEAIEELYLAALSRFPTSEERAELKERIGPRVSRKEILEDLLWALPSVPM